MVKFKEKEALERDLYREFDRLNKQALRAVKNYGTDSAVYKDVKKTMVELIQSTGSSINPFREGLYIQGKETGATQLSLSRSTIEKIVKDSMRSRNEWVKTQLKKSKEVNITNLVARYQAELANSSGKNMFAKSLKERKEIVKKYQQIQNISETYMWDHYGSEMGNARKSKMDKQVLSILFDIQNQTGQMLNDINISKAWELWKRGTSVRNLSDEEIKKIISAQNNAVVGVENDEEYQRFIRD